MGDGGQVEADAAFRAIGRYVVAFSQLIAFMRQTMASRLMKPGDGIHLAELAIGEAGANQMTDSFFAMCASMTDPTSNLDADEKAVARQLRKEVLDEIQLRNDIAHGDWWVWGDMDTTAAFPTSLIRLKPGRAKAPRTITSFSASDLEAATARLTHLSQHVGEFGQIALGVYPFARNVRVRDIFVVRGKQVLRQGPKAEHIKYG